VPDSFNPGLSSPDHVDGVDCPENRGHRRRGGKRGGNLSIEEEAGGKWK